MVALKETVETKTEDIALCVQDITILELLRMAAATEMEKLLANGHSKTSCEVLEKYDKLSLFIEMKEKLQKELNQMMLRHPETLNAITSEYASVMESLTDLSYDDLTQQ